MRRNGQQKGSAMILAMVLIVAVMGATAAMMIVAQKSAEDANVQADYAEALDVAEDGFNLFLKDARTPVAWNEEVEDYVAHVYAYGDEGPTLEPIAEEYKTLAMDGYDVQIRSAYFAYKNDPDLEGFLRKVTAEERATLSEPVFDIYEVTAQTSEAGAVGKHEMRRAIQAIVEMRKDPVQIAGALYMAEDDHVFNGNDWRVSGQDHDKDPKNLYPDYSLKMPIDGWLQATFVKSEAALDSALLMLDPATGAEMVTIPTNHPTSQVERSWYSPVNYPAGQELVFFGRVDAECKNCGIYDHYLVGHIDPWYDPVTNYTGGTYRGPEPKPEYMPYGCISLYKLKDTANPSLILASAEAGQKLWLDERGELTPALTTAQKDALQAQLLSTDELNAMYEVMEDADGNDYYKRYDLTIEDMALPEIRRVRYGLEDLKGKTDWSNYRVDWDHDDIVVDVYVLELPSGGEGGGGSWPTNYVVVQDDANTVKFEDAPQGLGEDGAVQSDTFVIEATQADQVVEVECKAGRGTASVYLANVGDSFTDDIGFTTTLLARDGNTYTFAVTSDDAGNTAALSHVTFIFPEGVTVTSPGGNNYAAPRVNGSADLLDGGEDADVNPYYEIICRPNEEDYLTEDNGKAVPGVAYEGEFCDIAPSNNTTGAFVTVDAAGNLMTNEEAYAEAVIDVPAVARAYVGTATEPRGATQVVTDLASANLGDHNNYTLTHVVESATVSHGTNIEGGGVLVVSGDLTVYGKLDFTGLLIVLGDLTLDPSAAGKNVFIRGAVMVAGQVHIEGKVDIWYSSEAVDKTLQDLDPDIRVVPIPRVWREMEVEN